MVGFHYIGPDAGEVTQMVGLPLKMGATKAQFDALIGIHPTCAEVSFYHDHDPLSNHLSDQLISIFLFTTL